MGEMYKRGQKKWNEKRGEETKIVKSWGHVR